MAKFNNTDSIFTIPEYLKNTFLVLVTNPTKNKVVNNIRILFEHLDVTTMEIPKDSSILIQLIQRAIEAIDLGIKDRYAIYDFAVISPDSQDVVDVYERLQEELSIDIQNLIIKWIESIIMKKPIYDKAEKFAELAVKIKHRGLKESINAFDEFDALVDGTFKELRDIKSAKVTDEIFVDETSDMGLERVAKERDEENNIVIDLFGALNAITGGGSRLRKTNLVVANTGAFKSGFLLNLALYAQNNANIPEEFLNGCKPAVLYITHENTLAQTSTRILAWYGYSKDDIDRMSRVEFQKTLRDCLMPKGNGVRLILKYADPNTMAIKDIDDMVEDLNASGVKIVMCCEDYVKHVLPDMRADQLANNVQAGDVIAISASALARKHFLSFWTASQFGREGLKIKEEQKEKGVDFLKKMHTGFMAGAYNATNSYDLIGICDRGTVPGTGEPYFAFKVCKDREDRNTELYDYYVIPFDVGGFKLHPTKWFTSVADMNPALSAMTDIYNTALEDIQAEMHRSNTIASAKKDLINHGYKEADINDMSDVDILQRAKHLADGAVVPISNKVIPLSTSVYVEDYSDLESFGAAA